MTIPKNQKMLGPIDIQVMLACKCSFSAFRPMYIEYAALRGHENNHFCLSLNLNVIGPD